VRADRLQRHLTKVAHFYLPQVPAQTPAEPQIKRVKIKQSTKSTGGVKKRRRKSKFTAEERQAFFEDQMVSAGRYGSNRSH
jgi:hypothetical protein